MLAYALFVFAVTVNGIVMYDGAAHKGLDPKVMRVRVVAEERRQT